MHDAVRSRWWTSWPDGMVPRGRRWHGVTQRPDRNEMTQHLGGWRAMDVYRQGYCGGNGANAS
jgi:hypothetical protein